MKNKIINDFAGKTLLRLTPAKILANLIGDDVANTHFKILDELNSSSVVDIETSNLIVLPKTITVEGNHLKKFKELSSATAYIAEQPGISRIVSPGNKNNYFVRVQNTGYIGLAEYRHLENINE